MTDTSSATAATPLAEAIELAREWVASDPYGSLHSQTVAQLLDRIEHAAGRGSRSTTTPRITSANGLPSGTVAVVGHPANGLTATKQPDGQWRANIEPYRAVSLDDIEHAGRIVYRPDLAESASVAWPEHAPALPPGIDPQRIAAVLDGLTDAADCWYGDSRICLQHGFTAWERCPHDEAREMIAALEGGARA